VSTHLNSDDVDVVVVVVDHETQSEGRLTRIGATFKALRGRMATTPGSRRAGLQDLAPPQAIHIVRQMQLMAVQLGIFHFRDRELAEVDGIPGGVLAHSLHHGSAHERTQQLVPDVVGRYHGGMSHPAGSVQLTAALHVVHQQLVSLALLLSTSVSTPTVAYEATSKAWAGGERADPTHLCCQGSEGAEDAVATTTSDA
jgi:hypothetical protein